MALINAFGAGGGVRYASSLKVTVIPVGIPPCSLPAIETCSDEGVATRDAQCRVDPTSIFTVNQRRQYLVQNFIPPLFHREFREAPGPRQTARTKLNPAHRWFIVGHHFDVGPALERL